MPSTTVVGSGGVTYPCDTVEKVDKHLSILVARLRVGPRWPWQTQRWRDDIDALLDKRAELARANAPAR